MNAISSNLFEIWFRLNIIILKLKDSANLIAVASVSAYMSLEYVVEVDRLKLLFWITGLVHHVVEVRSRVEVVVL